MKKALLFGINYTNDPSARLMGCIADTVGIAKVLTERMGYAPDDICLCTDETPLKPTRSMMTRLLRELVLWTHRQSVSQIFISYSGHGMSILDYSTDEVDGRDECLIPLDFRQHGVIIDDEIGKLLRQVHPRTDVVLLIDACHSGTMGDLPFRYRNGLKLDEHNVSVPARTIMISGCNDDETSLEIDGGGVMTKGFIHALEQSNYDITCFRLLTRMQEYAQSQGSKQRPQLSTSRELTETCIFMSNNINGKAFFIHE